MKTAAADTLGCRLNQADTALALSRLRAAGYEVAVPIKSNSSPDSSNKPDVVLINTCTVTANASRKSRQLARKFKKQFPDACVVVAGCDCVNNENSWLSEPGVDLVVANEMKPRVAELVDEYFKCRPASSPTSERPATPRAAFPSPEKREKPTFRENAFATFPFTTKAYIKVQEGCDAFCNYCIVPYVRGRERSRAWDEVIDEARRLLDDGHKELVLTGVNVSAYGDRGLRIADLVSKLAGVPGDFRIRLSSLEPNAENARLVDLMADNPKICRFLHVPLQHGTNEILRRMGRSEESAKFADFLNEAEEKVPGIHLGTDLIAGFPGETEELFEQSLEFLSKLPLANIHVFAFSAREGTPAAKFANQIPKRVSKNRADRLKELAETLAAGFADSQKGKPLTILLEKRVGETAFEGWSDNYLRARVEAPNAAVGDLVELKSFQNK
ncbi:MAG: tRNA (N(6)-L-threonylcarbamoyladenosine(37)-C(2))-methylthiotransferase MtaB [Kiritimatiellaeota bacterium]|nr:tRNA (N(6)-L-threonylcarbamoyladenosine(37)-C(2))-methylthiotransferase MtaB [Kiritimatiellota bacterium]